MNNNWFIRVDFDGTITDRDTTDFVLQNFAAAEWEDIETSWKNGEIDANECMKRQAALIDATPEQITLLLDQVKIDAHFTDFLKLCQHWKVPVQVLSDGYNFNIKTILQKNSLSHLDVAANNLAYLGQNRFEFTSLHIHDNCRSGYHACKCGKLSSGGTEILIGDGSSDFCAAHSADIVIAKDSLLAYCRKNNIPHIPFRNFSEVTHILARIFMEDQSRGNKWIPDIPMNLSYVVGEIE